MRPRVPSDIPVGEKEDKMGLDSNGSYLIYGLSTNSNNSWQCVDIPGGRKRKKRDWIAMGVI